MKKKTNSNELKAGKQIFPGIVIIDNVLDDCQHYIDVALEHEPLWEKSMVGIDREYESSIRTSDVLFLDIAYYSPVEWHTIAHTIWKYGLWYAKSYDIEFSRMETPQLLHYTEKSGFYKSHHDDGPGMHRIFSALLYLNDVEEGGETYFTNFDISIQPKAGRLALFPANYVYEHEARIPMAGSKFVVVTWFNPVE